jgi:DNA-binding HxlR family transcriptional regulator
LEQNAVARMLGLLGDEWTLLVAQRALMGATRYAEFKEQLPISNSVLTRRLQTLTDAGVLNRRTYQSNPPRSEYLMTPRGRSLWPVLLSIWEWERRWVPDHAERLPGMRHTACGDDFAPLVACRACGETATEKDIVAQWGPTGSWQRSMPMVATRRRSVANQRDAAAGMFPQTMSVMGNRWAFALLVAAFVGVSRFTDFQTQLGAPPGSIADRLSIFTANHVLEVADNRYRLTEKGRAFFPVLVTALQWAQ